MKIYMKNIAFVFSLTCLLVACSNERDPMQDETAQGSGIPLKFTLATAPVNGATRAVILNNSKIEGTIGLTMRGTDGGSYQGKNYDNIPYVYRDSDWETAGKDIIINDAEGKLYAYYPYNSAASDIKNIPITLDNNLNDYMYADLSTVSAVNSKPSLLFHHALAVLELNIVRNTDVTDSKLKSITISGAGIANAGTLDATTGKITPSNSNQEVTVTYNDDYVPTVDDVAADNTKQMKKYLLLIPNELSDSTSTGLDAGTITIKVKMDTTVYALTSKSKIMFRQGAMNSYKITGITSGTFISDTDGLTFVNDAGKQEFNVKNITGIMITDKKYLPGNHKIIVRTAINPNKVQWRNSDDPFMNITYYATTDGANTWVELIGGSGTGLTHTDGPWIGCGGSLGDFEGKSNTAAIVKANGGYDGSTYPIINANADALKAGWYIPSLGQLAVIFKYKNALNNELKRIIAAGGSAAEITSGMPLWWSSSTNGGGSAFVIYSDNGTCGTRAQSSADWTRTPNLVRDAD
jgi:hypothetical protein